MSAGMHEYEFFIDDIQRHLAAYTPERRQELIKLAQVARGADAKSYRDFFVGCTVLGAHPRINGDTEYRAFPAGNYTPNKKNRSEIGKWCAERVAVNAALSEGATFIPAMVSVSMESDRGENEHDHGVLHPCPECRNLLRHLLEEKILHEQTMICNVNDRDPEHVIISERTVRELLDLYKNDVINAKRQI